MRLWLTFLNTVPNYQKSHEFLDEVENKERGSDFFFLTNFSNYPFYTRITSAFHGQKCITIGNNYAAQYFLLKYI